MIFENAIQILGIGFTRFRFKCRFSIVFFLFFGMSLYGQHGFVYNAGQVFDQYNQPNSRVQFLNRIGDFQVQLNRSGFSYELFKSHKSNDSVDIHRLDFQFVNIYNHELSLNWTGQEKRNDYNNYYNQLGKFDHVPLFQSANALIGNGQIIAHNINRPEGGVFFKYDIITKYGDLSKIRLRVSGADSIQIFGSDLYLFICGDTLIETIPETRVSNESNSSIIPLIWKCIDKEKYMYGFACKEEIEYPKNSTLTIDPIPMLRWATYFGGGSNDAGYGTATTSDGNAIFCGQTASNSQVASSGAHQTTIGGKDDIFLCKFHRDGGTSSRIWSTYLGGANSEYATAVAVDSKDFIAITGLTYTS